MIHDKNLTDASLALRDDERQRCEVWTRVMGYHRPASSFNIGKKGEFHERLHFEETRAAL
ncbi:anaerobic ribonucleoside-triphosphate reductase [Paracoccus litorisediminis]|nr:anaerobic ribonucleoside-triphosphate reductase [Paracoccus litorisediminis]